MSSFFEDLNDLITENSTGRVLAFALLILIGSAVLAMLLVFGVLKLIYRHIA